MLKVKLKTKKQLQQMGYVFNPNSLFAPMSIDVKPDERRFKDNRNKIIPHSIYTKLGKEIYVDVASAEERDGVICARFSTLPDSSRRNGHWLPLAITKDEAEVKNLKDKHEAQQKALEAKEKRESEFKNKKVTGPTIGGYKLEYFVNQKVFKAGCRDISAIEMKRALRFISKQLKTR